MTQSEMGQIMAFLLKYRRLETIPTKRRKDIDEKALATKLRNASSDDRAAVEQMLHGFGHDLISYTWSTTQGLAPGADVFLLVRRTDGEHSLFSEKWIEERMQVRGDSVRDRRIWFCQFWFVLYSMFYSMRGRVPNEVGRYVDTTFAKSELVGATRKYINEFVRKLDPDQIADKAIHVCLTAEHGALLDQYADRFLGLMVDGGQLDEVSKDKYRQSLLSAAEIKSNFLQGLEPLFAKITQSENPLEPTTSLLVKAGESDATLEE